MLTKAANRLNTPPTNPTSQQREALAWATELLNRAGLRLETNGHGYQVAHGRQILVGVGRRNYEMSIDEVVAFTRKALVR